MSEKISSGAWVQIERIVLSPDERAPRLPDETAACPLVLRVKGFLKTAASLGDAVEVETIIGRVFSGRLVAENPPYKHDFGRPLPELLKVRDDFPISITKGGVVHGGIKLCRGDGAKERDYEESTCNKL